MTDEKQEKEHNSDSLPEPAEPEAVEAEAVEPEADNGDIDDLAALVSASGEDSLLELMATNFVEYASYVIKDRAIPDVHDGLKPVQRRILHSLHVMDDGRFHKVANVIGHTMQYHPHGDQSIGNALVVLANKEYFIDKQGNFGNIHTGDRASAARYIECRLTPLAREVLFNDEITEFVDSYDGRKREPVTLPAKVPSLLMLGSDGIAVGMTTHVLPHNFCELLNAQIAILRKQPYAVYPDFLTAGLMDVNEYDNGLGRIKLRAKMEAVDEKTLVVREIPATTTTESLISSVEEAARRGKIKIASINDYTAESVEIEIKLPRGIYAKETVKQLYAYTDCEVSISSNIVVIHENRPVRMSVDEVLRLNTDKLVDDLRRELEIALGKLQERFHEKTLAQIFIENRIYKRIEECETYESVLSEVRSGLEEFRHMLRRDITDEDIEKLLQIQIRRISRFDLNKNREDIDNILRGIDETQDNLAHLTRYAVKYIRDLLKKYGKAYPRRTCIEDLEEVDARAVALRNIRVGHDRVGHFVGTDVRNSNKNEEPLQCTEFDRLVLLGNTGKFKVVPIPDKVYVGPVKYLLRSDKEQVYSMIYRDRKRGGYYAKRFRIDRYIMDREYKTAPPNSIIECLYVNYGVVVRCEHKPNKRLKDAYVDVDFDEIPIRSAGAKGFKVTPHPVEGLTQLRRGTPEPPGSGDTGEEEPAEPEPQDVATDAEATPAVAKATSPEPAAEPEQEKVPPAAKQAAPPPAPTPTPAPGPKKLRTPPPAPGKRAPSGKEESLPSGAPAEPAPRKPSRAAASPKTKGKAPHEAPAVKPAAAPSPPASTKAPAKAKTKAPAKAKAKAPAKAKAKETSAAPAGRAAAGPRPEEPAPRSETREARAKSSGGVAAEWERRTSAAAKVSPPAADAAPSAGAPPKANKDRAPAGARKTRPARAAAAPEKKAGEQDADVGAQPAKERRAAPSGGARKGRTPEPKGRVAAPAGPAKRGRGPVPDKPAPAKKVPPQRAAAAEQPQQPESAASSKPAAAGKPKPKPKRESPRRLIDEETPFFLE